jgi:hypothetical protein
MGGGLLQLSAYGSQNEYLNGNPQMTFFKIVYKRFTNFSMESISQNFVGSNELNQINKIKLQCKIPRNADLITNTYFTFNIPDIYSGYNPISNTNYKFQWIKNLGTNIIDHVEILIGGQVIDKHYGEWLNIWTELNLSESKLDNYNYLIGNVPELYDPENYPGNNGIYPTSTLNPELNIDPEYNSIDYLQVINPYERAASIKGRKIYVPLRFWFCQNSGLALPLIALQYHEVYINIELKALSNLYTIIDTDEENPSFGQRIKPNPLKETDSINNFLFKGNINDIFTENIDMSKGNIFSFTGWGLNPGLEINYIFLDVEERKQFAKTTHEFLITQVSRNQFLGVIGNKSLKLILNHPVKQLIWTAKRNDMELKNIYNNYTNWIDEDIDPSTISYINELYNLNNKSKLSIDIIKENIPNKKTSIYYEKDILKNAKLLFEGKDRISIKDNIYFNYVEPYNSSLSSPKTGIYSYSFEIDNKKYQPSGICNMSRIKNITLEVETNRTEPIINLNENLNYKYMFDFNIYAVNYNILRFMAGMGGLTFSS